MRVLSSAINQVPARARHGLWAAGAGFIGTALVFRPIVGEGGWIDHVAQSGALLLAIATAVEIVSRTPPAKSYRRGVGFGLAALLALGWVNAAVGIIGSESNPANAVYLAVLVVVLIGAVASRLRPRGLASTMLASAITLLAIAFLASAGQLQGAHTDLFEVMRIHGIFITLFLGAGALFSSASEETRSPEG